MQADIKLFHSGSEILEKLLKDHETAILELRKWTRECTNMNSDNSTVDRLSGLINGYETKIWALRRFLS